MKRGFSTGIAVGLFIAAISFALQSDFNGPDRFEHEALIAAWTFLAWAIDGLERRKLREEIAKAERDKRPC